MLTKSKILETDQITVWASKGVVIPAWHICSSRYSTPVKVEWDPTKTNVVSARLVVTKAVAQHDPVTLSIWLNAILVKTIYWPEGTKGTEKSAVVDVIVPLRSGTNNFEVALCRDYRWGGKATATISAYLEYEYEGKDPEAEVNWWQLFKEWMKKNWWMTIPAVALAVIAAPAALPRRTR